MPTREVSFFLCQDGRLRSEGSRPWVQIFDDFFMANGEHEFLRREGHALKDRICETDEIREQAYNACFGVSSHNREFKFKFCGADVVLYSLDEAKRSFRVVSEPPTDENIRAEMKLRGFEEVVVGREIKFMSCRLKDYGKHNWPSSFADTTIKVIKGSEPEKGIILIAPTASNH